MKAALALIFSLVFTIVTSADDTTPYYSQSYVILIKGAEAGTETVTEKRNEKGELVSSSGHEIFVTDGLEVKRMAFTTTMVFEKDTKTPVSLALQYITGSGSGDSYDVRIKDGQITRLLNKRGQIVESTVPFQPNMLIFDNSAYHQYDYLVQHYDMKKGGRQQFQYFVPVIANDIPLALTFLGDDDIDFKNGKIPVKNFKIEFVGIWGGTFAVDRDNRLVRLVVPAQNLEVLRKDIWNYVKPDTKPPTQ